MMLDPSNPKVWVAAAFFIFFALTGKKLARLAANGLDNRAAKIKAELDEARRLREEAEAVLAEYKQKQAQYLQEAEAMFKRAEEDAKTLTAHAEKELRAALDERMKNAVEKIAQEENNAIAAVRNHVVDVALAATRAVIAEQSGKEAQDALVKQAIADIERKIH